MPFDVGPSLVSSGVNGFVLLVIQWYDLKGIGVTLVGSLDPLLK